jgi:hypothetical protein
MRVLRIVSGLCFLALSSVAQDGTASLTGIVKDITGAGVPGTRAELSLESAPDTKFEAITDAMGAYHFSGLPAGDYTLKLLCPGFKYLTVKLIHVLDGDRKSLPDLQLEIAASACGPPSAYLDHKRILPSGSHTGDLGGSVRLDQQKEAPPIAGIDVTLICNTGKDCGATKTDSNGEFIFRALSSGYFSIRFASPGFYPLNQFGFWVEEGFELMFWPVGLERCASENCDLRLHPKKPIGLCE